MNLAITRTCIGLSLILAVACNKDPNDTKIQYLPDMADGPIVKAQREYLDPPEGSVSSSAILYPATADASEKVLQNPFLQYPEGQAEKGKKFYNIYCLPCHGDTGKGDGLVSAKFPAPPDITTEAYAKRGDGFFFHTITFGVRNMPSYGHSIAAHERWLIVMYLRELQKVGP